MPPGPHLETTLAQANHYLDPATGAIVPPVQPSTTYARDERYELIGPYSYARSHAPGHDALERLAAELDGGTDAQAFSSGLAAVAAVLETLDPGDHVVAPRIMYHGAQDWMRRVAAKRGIGLSLFDSARPEALREVLRPGETSLVWIETPINPTWDIIDIESAAAAAHEAGAFIVVDSTVAPPVTTRALDHGADLVFHSATKYLNGHSDVVAGLLVTRDVEERWEEIKLVRTLMGGVLGAFEAWLLLRGMRTLAIRFERASASALRVARHLEGHPGLESVLYPGLSSHPGHHVAKKQMRNGFGGMLSICINGDFAATQAVANRARVFVRATSLGGVESLIEHRTVVEGAHSHVPENLLRLSIGIEHVEDLIADLDQALGDVP